MYKDSNNPISADCELALRTHRFPAPPDTFFLAADSYSPTGYIRGEPAWETADLGFAKSRLTLNDGCLTQSFLFSALVAVLFLGSYRRIRSVLNKSRRGPAMANDRASNRRRGSDQAEDTSNTIAISQMSPGSGRPPAKILRHRL